ncbi:pimeloyl-CoA dehydrogenase small subunit [Verticiella sediminum]|uniref:Pimeloyl-CoA dehydrogenase small subunit n=1 Tax=Verticiella sediminum TaxID=1247510 RepID=A0A556ACC0_9BURK|nr:acyl-CoA dehydrogenase [Verticiella sediminum]TSH90534.1 pimeloyl-CoA dehydrogenase small subunit [Verticiella sediminum]
MNFELDQDQQMLADSLRRFLADHYDFESRKRIIASDAGYSPEVWAGFAETGLLGLPLPEEVGGFGGGAVALMSVMEALGEYLVVEPYLPTVLASRLIAQRGSGAQHEAILGPVIAGELKLALAHGEPESRYQAAQVATRAEASGDGWKLSGRKQLVFGAPMADKIVVSARTAGTEGDADGISLFVVDAKAPGLKMTAYRTLDNQRAADIVLNGVSVSSGELLGDAGNALADIEAAFDFANTMLCAEASGAIRSANADTLEYLKTRKQFGAPIGSFQALQHRMVDMFVTQEQMRSMQYLVCSRLDTLDDAQERARIASGAKIKTADACRQISQEAVQLHGGMGMTEELKVSHTFRRLTLIGQQFGDADYHLERYARLQDAA